MLVNWEIMPEFHGSIVTASTGKRLTAVERERKVFPKQ
jgi:hypothetical protein